MDARVSVIEKRLQNIQKIIAVASGKGGVGKSMVASLLALRLSQTGYKVGLLDLDLYGPSAHIVLGVTDEFPEEEKGLIPPNIQGINFMSIVYFTEDKPSAFRGLDITNIIIELLAITQWGALDYLIIDMPPGIGDETLDIIRYIKNSKFLVVSTPSKVALGAVRKLLQMLQELHLPILGVVENMKMHETEIVKNETKALALPYLGSIHFDEKLEEVIGNPHLLLRSRFIKELDSIVKKMENSKS